MIKKIDYYIIKTFFGPFFFIFSILFFIFIVNVVWIQMFNLGEKGLKVWELVLFFYYLSVQVIRMVLPLTILLAAIMTFGGFGERYELAAMKSAGISLLRVMKPLFFVTAIMAFLLFLFSNYIIPDFQRKAKNMLYNIASTRPTVNFTTGHFITSLPGITIKMDKIYGKNDEFIEGVFLHKSAHFYEDQRTIIAEKGEFLSATKTGFIKLMLFNGYIYEEKISNTSRQNRGKQEGQTTKFDTLIAHLDVREAIERAMNNEKVTDSHIFKSFLQINKHINRAKEEQNTILENITSEIISQSNIHITNNTKITKVNIPFFLDSLKTEKKLNLLYNAHKKITTLKQIKKNKEPLIFDTTKLYTRIVMHQQQIISFSITCIIFFMIGASLGSIIRKGGMGLPVVIAIFIFVIFYLINLTVENIAWKGNLNPYLAAWFPNLIFSPFSLWFTYKALADSQIFDINKYKALLMPLIRKLKKETEHKRYQ